MTLKAFLLLCFLVLLMISMPFALLLKQSKSYQASVHIVDSAEMIAGANEDFWPAADEHDASGIPVVIGSAELLVPPENASIPVLGMVDDDGLEEGGPNLNSSSWTHFEDIVIGTGTVRFLKLEGGFYGIVGDDGENYDPLNLSDEFKVDGLRVRFEAAIIHDVLTFHMWGSLVSIRTIEELLP